MQGHRVVQFELTTIRADANGEVILLPHPDGHPSGHAFRLTSVESGAEPSAVFEAPENDFPKRIVYRRAAGSPAVLVARIDNGPESEHALEWRMAVAPCGMPASGD
jgi:hypothetical protein